MFLKGANPSFRFDIQENAVLEPNSDDSLSLPSTSSKSGLYHRHTQPGGNYL
jgi:hypothetical protein